MLVAVGEVSELGAGDAAAEPAWSERQSAVLEAALRLIVESGDALTMSAVARRASCSKETLYKWFGDRDGLLTATVQWQASKVQVAPVDRARLDLASLGASLTQFAAGWLTVISSDTSVALNRLAVSHAGSHKTDLGRIVLDNGRLAMGRRLKPVLEAGRAAGLIAFDDTEAAFRVFFGLVARDIQIRLLLGDRIDLSAAEIDRDARAATRQFLALHPGAGQGRD
ncbi:TetR/AcrR family transcriptional regulator [Methylobrevis albus]|uniref:TetR/AcrR family transcriptional regulator n=1 Tax=Methylobrevis albus TaxID=2793297 RepID=A0A931HZQ1_9HYPH|nr:TetR/AcrR family transcriptional regulator [Methylobrevis albus]MBH0236734.1 TetR/AcrR family transcriptional regulator [Methylobrevis albus]